MTNSYQIVVSRLGGVQGLNRYDQFRLKGPNVQT
jgi:hypothetical protein